MRAPLILVVPGTQPDGPEFLDYSLSLAVTYLQAIQASGGLPWVLSSCSTLSVIAESVRRSDGVLLTGGDDIQPELYTRRLSARLRQTLSPVDPRRDWLELALIREVFRQRKPLLAICRGLQILNVAFGGTLLVDLPSQLPQGLNHSQLDLKDRAVHQVQVEPGSLLAEVSPTGELGVNSTHHQALRDVPSIFRITAKSSDGVVEAMELGLAERGLLPYLLAVQFHPERLIARYPAFQRVFRGFTGACAGRKISI